MASTDARPVPLKNVAYRVTFPILDADGDLVTGATGLDSEVSIDGGAFADATSEATELATASGMYYLDLTAAEMNGDTIAVIVKTSTVGAKTTPIILYPEEAGDIRANLTQWSGTAPSALIAGRVDANAQVVGAGAITAAAVADGAIDAATFAAGAIDAAAIAADAIGASELAQGAADKVWASATRALTDKSGFALAALDSWVIHSGTAQGGAASSVTLAAGAAATDDLYKGQVVKLYGGTGAAQARVVTAYNGTSKVATVNRAWAVNPDATSTYAVLALEAPTLDASLRVTAESVTGAVASVTGAVGSVTGAVGSVASGGIAAAALATAAVNRIADHVLRRTYANARASADGDALSFRSLMGAIGKLVNKVAISGTTLTIFQEDDATSTAPGGTQAITTSASANPIVELDTA